MSFPGLFLRLVRYLGQDRGGKGKEVEMGEYFHPSLTPRFPLLL